MEHKTELEYVAGNMRAYRARLGYSGAECGRKLGITRQAYLGFEKNPESLKLTTLQKIADVLQCDIGDFFIKFNVPKSNANETQR